MLRASVTITHAAQQTLLLVHVDEMSFAAIGPSVSALSVQHD
jgi:hypothetical protein